jgi:AcrR family transcriptional regulator
MIERTQSRQPAPAALSRRQKPSRNSELTKKAIVAAARRAFTDRSYDLVGVREVAEAAGVDRALVVRYFGSKEGLFRAALENALTVKPLIEMDRAQFGKQTVELFLAWTGHPAVRMVVHTASHPDFHAYLLEQFEARLIEPLAEWLGEPRAKSRATSLMILWMGFYLLWDMKLPILRNADHDVMGWLERATQDIVDDIG